MAAKNHKQMRNCWTVNGFFALLCKWMRTWKDNWPWKKQTDGNKLWTSLVAALAWRLKSQQRRNRRRAMSAPTKFGCFWYSVFDSPLPTRDGNALQVSRVAVTLGHWNQPVSSDDLAADGTGATANVDQVGSFIWRCDLEKEFLLNSWWLRHLRRDSAISSRKSGPSMTSVCHRLRGHYNLPNLGLTAHCQYFPDALSDSRKPGDIAPCPNATRVALRHLCSPVSYLMEELPFGWP